MKPHNIVDITMILLTGNSRDVQPDKSYYEDLINYLQHN